MIVDVVYDPTNAAVAYAAAPYALYKSTNGGVSWTELNQDFGQFPITRVMFDQSTPARLYVVAVGGGVFRSTDAANTFTRISAIPSDPNVDGPWGFTISADGNTLYYSTIGRKFYRSTDSGVTFAERTAMPAQAQMLLLDPANSSIVYAAFGQKLLRSTNGGDSWAELPLPTSTTTFVESIVLTPGAPNTLWASTATDVYSTQTEGAWWGRGDEGYRLQAEDCR